MYKRNERQTDGQSILWISPALKILVFIVNFPVVQCSSENVKPLLASSFVFRSPGKLILKGKAGKPYSSFGHM